MFKLSDNSVWAKCTCERMRLPSERHGLSEATGTSHSFSVQKLQMNFFGDSLSLLIEMWRYDKTLVEHNT